MKKKKKIELSSLNMCCMFVSVGSGHTIRELLSSNTHLATMRVLTVLRHWVTKHPEVSVTCAVTLFPFGFLHSCFYAWRKCFLNLCLSAGFWSWPSFERSVNLINESHSKQWWINEFRTEVCSGYYKVKRLWFLVFFIAQKCLLFLHNVVACGFFDS